MGGVNNSLQNEVEVVCTSLISVSRLSRSIILDGEYRWRVNRDIYKDVHLPEGPPFQI